jgi:SAM-dependent methyltransferase
VADDWQWDETLYAGSARFYPAGRVAYPPALAQALRGALSLDGRGRLLDVGCGPGSLTLLLAPLFDGVIGLDPDREMLAEAERIALAAGVANVTWVRLRAEQLPANLGSFRVVSFAQSFHWTRRREVAAAVRGMLEPGGALVLVHATTHRGVDSPTGLAHPQPPHEQIEQLVRRYLGPVPRAGAGVRPVPPSGDEAARAESMLREAGYRGPRRIEIPPTGPVQRSEEEVVASVFSLSSAAPHLFAERLPAFEADLRALLREASADGRFAELLRETTVDIWEP